jgi:hypothetical protein
MAIKDLIIEEQARRSEAWAVLLREGGPLAVSPKVLRKLGIYGGAQGIWVDKGRTAGLTSSGAGIAVGSASKMDLLVCLLARIYVNLRADLLPLGKTSPIHDPGGPRSKRVPVLRLTDASPGKVPLPKLIDQCYTLFDRGYISVTPDHRVRVSRRLKADFDNGEHYYQLEGSPLWVPRSSEAQPRGDLLEWHADTVFRS